jgi:hypothetical protein
MPQRDTVSLALASQDTSILSAGDRFDRSSHELLRDANDELVAGWASRQNSLRSRDQLRRFAAQTLTQPDQSPIARERLLFSEQHSGVATTA